MTKQAIMTKYIGPTNSRNSRIKASAPAGSITISYDRELNEDDNHKQAAEALCDKFNWKISLIGGVLKNGAYVWVQDDFDYSDQRQRHDERMEDLKR